MNLEQMKKTDPEFAQCFENFALDEVVNEEGQLALVPVCRGTELFQPSHCAAKAAAAGGGKGNQG